MSETINNSGTARVHTVSFSELDIEILLKALGRYQINQQDSRLPTKSIDILLERIYRAMGVRL